MRIKVQILILRKAYSFSSKSNFDLVTALIQDVSDLVIRGTEQSIPDKWSFVRNIYIY